MVYAPPVAPGKRVGVEGADRERRRERWYIHPPVALGGRRPQSDRCRTT